MRIRIILAAVLAVAVVGLPATADPEAPTEPERIVDEVTLYLHGTETVGELDIDLSSYRDMDRTAPAGTTPKSVQVVNYVGGPNTRCDGNFLLPTWQAPLRGTVVGDVTVTLPAISAPGTQLVVELHANAATGCVTEPPVPVPTAREVVTMPAGLGEATVTFSDVEFDVNGMLNLFVHANTGTVARNHSRLLYDAQGYEARVELTCLAQVGRPSCSFR
jgi:hypothetical protein